MGVAKRVHLARQQGEYVPKAILTALGWPPESPRPMLRAIPPADEPEPPAPSPSRPVQQTLFD